VDAQAALERAVEIEPDEPPLHSALADLHTRASNPAAAEQQQALVVALSGVAKEVEDPRRADDRGARRRGGSRGEFAALVASFTATPERRPIGAWRGWASCRRRAGPSACAPGSCRS
jgi:hypothetical protein